MTSCPHLASVHSALDRWVLFRYDAFRLHMIIDFNTRRNTNTKLANDWAPFNIFPSTPRVTYSFAWNWKTKKIKTKKTTNKPTLWALESSVTHLVSNSPRNYLESYGRLKPANGIVLSQTPREGCTDPLDAVKWNWLRTFEKLRLTKN